MSLRMLKDLFSDSNQAEKRVTTVGTWASGKTTALGLLYLTCETLSSQDPNFKYRIVERSSGIRQAPSDLRRGRFPESTQPGFVYEADLVLKWEGRFGDKTVKIPFCETAGEDIQKLIGRFSKSMYHMEPGWQTQHEAETLYKHILKSNGFIITCPVPRACMFKNGEALEKGPGDLPADPDINIARILQEIFDYKEQTRSPPIEGLAVLLTKYDIIAPQATAMGMDLYNIGGIATFMDSYFPQTSAALKYYGLQRIKFFPSHVQVERISETEFRSWPNGGYKIVMNPHRPRMPMYSEQSYINIIQWIRETFTK